MKLKCGLTYASWYKYQTEWHDWFAWRPVKIGDNDCRWLEYVQRKRIDWHPDVRKFAVTTWRESVYRERTKWGGDGDDDIAVQTLRELEPVRPGVVRTFEVDRGMELTGIMAVFLVGLAIGIVGTVLVML